MLWGLLNAVRALLGRRKAIQHLPDASSSSSTPSLPPELLVLVLEHMYTEPGRHPTLITCCLVSRAFREVAQPLLYRSVKLLSKKSMERFVKSSKKREEGQPLVKRCLVGGKNEKTRKPRRMVGEILRNCEQLRSLWINGIDGTIAVEEFCDGSAHPSLRHIVICGVEIRRPAGFIKTPPGSPRISSSCPLFPNVTCLQLSHLILDTSAVDLFKSVCFPSLHTLFISAIYPLVSTPPSPSPYSTVFHSLGPQLRTIYLEGIGDEGEDGDRILPFVRVTYPLLTALHIETHPGNIGLALRLLDAPILEQLHLRPYLSPEPNPLTFADTLEIASFARDLNERIRMGLVDHWNLFETGTLQTISVPNEVEIGARPRGLLAVKGIKVELERMRRGIRRDSEDFVRVFDAAEEEELEED